jgi:hypothetical protein
MADGSVSTLTNPITGTIASGQVAFGTASGVIGGDSGLFWNNVNKRLELSAGTRSQPSLTFNNQIDKRFGFYSNNDGVVGFALGGTYCDFSEARINFNNNFIINRVSVSKTNPTIAFIGGSPVSGIYRDPTVSSNVKIVTNATDKAIFFTTGNFLIQDGGTFTDAGFRLDVNGTARVTGQLTLGSTITNGTHTYTLPSATGTLALTSDLGAYLPLSGGTLTGALGGTSATFSGGVNLATSSGNVGIGTTSPEGTFHTNRTTDGTVAVFGKSSGSINPRLRIDVSEADNTISFNPNYSGAVSPSLRFLTGEIERMSIASGGNVLINTTTDAGFKLDVNGTGRFSGTAGNGSSFFNFNTTSANSVFNWVSTAFASNLAVDNNLIHFIGQSGSTKNSAYLGFKYKGSGSNNNILTLGLYAVDNVLNINGLGNVGIGTESPSNKLSVFNTLGLPSSSALTEAIILVQDSGSNRRLGIGSSTSGQWIQSSYPGFDGVASTLLLNPSGGNVLINTTSDTGLYKLDVNGTGRFSGGVNLATSSGNVGIGTASPQRTLHISGGTGTEFELTNTAMASGAKNFNIWGYPVDGTWNIRTLSDDSTAQSVNFVSFVASTGAATFSSSVTASSLIKSGGTSSQYLMADGSTKTIGASGSGTISGTGVLTFSGTGSQSNFDTGIVYQSTLTDFNTLMVVTPITPDAGSYLYSLYFIDQGGGLFTYGIVFSLAPASGTNNIKFNYILTQIPK